MNHPAQFYIKYLIIKNPSWTDADVQKRIQDWGFLPPPSWDDKYFVFLRNSIPAPPPGFDPLNLTDRSSVIHLRNLGIYEIFRNSPEMQEAWDILANPDQRLVVEQIILSRLDLKQAALRINKRTGWFLSEEGIKLFRHYFWNSKLLTFDEWGKFLYNRSMMYERHMALLHGDPRVALHHLRIDQGLESKMMIQRSQEIAYFTLEEVNLIPGTRPDKVKAIGVLSKAIVECHEALSTSDMALKDVLKQFERFRVEHPAFSPPDIHKIAPIGNYSGGGKAEKKDMN